MLFRLYHGGSREIFLKTKLRERSSCNPITMVVEGGWVAEKTKANFWRCLWKSCDVVCGVAKNITNYEM